MAERLSDPQHLVLWAIWLGSKGAGSHAGTVASLLRRGLIAGREYQGEWIWETTPEGDDVIASDERSQP